MADNKKHRDTEAAREPGFFSDHGYGSGTAITVLHDPAKPKKERNSSGSAKSKKKR